MMSASSCVCDRGLLGGCWCQKTPRSGSMLACRYMVLTNTEIAPLPAPILRSACPLHPSGSPNSRAPPARAPRHIPKPPPTHIPTSPTVPIPVCGVDKHRNSTSPRPNPSLSMPPAPHSRAPPAPAPRRIPMPTKPPNPQPCCSLLLPWWSWWQQSLQRWSGWSRWLSWGW